MALGIKVDTGKVLGEIVKAGRLRTMVPEGYAKPQRQCEAELLLVLRRERLAMTDWEFRNKYMEYIKR